MLRLRTKHTRWAVMMVLLTAVILGSSLAAAAATTTVTVYRNNGEIVYVYHTNTVHRWYTYRTTSKPVVKLVPVSTGTTAQKTPSPTPAPTPVPAPQPAQGIKATAEEQTMLQLVNQERAKAGVAPLKMDLRLVDLARKKSLDMIQKNYFDHTSPTYGTPFDMMKKAGITYHYAGENLAGAADVQRAHTLLMNSPGHRANILNPNYTSVGIGIVHGGPYGVMFTQMFIG